jgi:lysophospholipase L1-like esterase
LEVGTAADPCPADTPATYNVQHSTRPEAWFDVSASTTGKTGSFFCDDHTHLERTGAQQIGDLIVQALREQNIGLADYLE